MPPDSDGPKSAPQSRQPAREEYTVVCNLNKALPGHSDKIMALATKAHSITRLASQLLNLHVRRCLEENLPLSRLGYHRAAIQAWYAVTRVKNSKRSVDPELEKTRSRYMKDVDLIDSSGMSETLTYEAERWAVSFSTNAYLHFPKRVQCYVRSHFKLTDEEYQAMDRQGRAQRRRALDKVAKDLCSDPSCPLASPAEYHSFIAEKRVEWKLKDFPWQMYPGMPLKYHMKADDVQKSDRCNAHLLLPAMRCMLLHREEREQRGFAMLPLRTSLVPRHTHFGEGMLRPALGLGLSEERKEQKRQSAKRHKLAKSSALPRKEAEDSDDESDAGLGLPPLCGGHEAGDGGREDGDQASSGTGVAEVAEAAEQTGPSQPPPLKRKTRSKAEREEARRRDLASLFDLKAAGVHDCVGKSFNCTFTSDGYAMHLHFSRPKPKSEGQNKVPRRGVHDIEDLADRMRAQRKEAAPSGEQVQAVDSMEAPKDKLQAVCKMRSCLCCEASFDDPFPGFICVGCDPGKNEPAVLVDPLHPDRKMRMTLMDRRHHTLPGSYILTERHQRQKERKGGVAKLEESLVREDAAYNYRKQYVDKPEHITRLESEVGELEHSQSSHAATLAGFATYLSAIRQREPVLVPHYEQLHQRKLRYKAHVERQRYESRFIRGIRRKFDPEGTGKTIVLCWGAWGKIAGRPGTPGNRGRPSTLGVGLVKRLAREDGIVVGWTPEHLTTKTHHKCGGECVRCPITEQRRAREAGFRHTHKEIRGLKRCSACHHYVNRDFNAALNIGTNGLLLLSGCSPIRTHDAIHAEILTINKEMLGA